MDFLKSNWVKDVIACEKNQDLKKILQSKCRVIADDFLDVTSDMISHVDYILMNPPFSADEQHIIHAYSIAPAGCTIVSLCNYSTYKNDYSTTRKQLKSIIDKFGSIENLGSCFDAAERTTDVKIGLIRIKKAGESSSEFDGFFMDEEVEAQGDAIMPYNFVRDLVNRYVNAIKIFDKQMEFGIQMNTLTSSFFSSKLSFSCTSENSPVLRNDFKKDLQKSAWQYIFSKMNMQKYATRGLKEDINKFVEKQTEVPFTMKNIYKMIEIVIGTAGSRMDKAIIEVFDKLTMHHHENRHNVEGWKTNSHYLMGVKFIMPGLCHQDSWNRNSSKINTSSYGNDTIGDFIKALCYLTGTNYDTIDSFYTHTRDRLYGDRFDYAFFTVRCYKKGTAHFEFKDKDVWAMFNQHVARIKGYPLFEGGKRNTKKAA